MPVVKIDGQVIGGGRPGEIATKLREAYHGVAEISPLHGLLT